MYENYNDRTVSLAHREATRLVAEDDGRFFKIAVSMLVPDTEVTAENVTTPCCFWAGKHYPKNNPVLLAARTSQHGISVSRYLWMVKNRKALDPKAIVYHLCGNRRCVAPDHLFTAPNMAVVIGKLKSTGVIQKCIRDGVLFRIWNESGNHGYLATPPEWMIDYETEPEEETFDVVEWAAGLLAMSVGDVLELMQHRAEKHRLRVDPLSPDYNCYKTYAYDILKHTDSDGDEVFEEMLDLDRDTLDGWRRAASVMEQMATRPAARDKFSLLGAVAEKMLLDLGDEPYRTLRDMQRARTVELKIEA